MTAANTLSMQTFLLRTMQAMMLFSICILGWLAVRFFDDFIFKTIVISQQQVVLGCGTKSPDEGYLSSENALDGKALFNANCASCHRVDQDLTGPALQGVEDRWPDKKKLYMWIRNSEAVLKTGDKYTNALVKKFNGARMVNFPNLTDEEIDAILRYLNHWENRVRSLPTP